MTPVIFFYLKGVWLVVYTDASYKFSGNKDGGMRVTSWMLCMSSRRTISGRCSSPVGCLERVLGLVFLTLGMCTILK